MFKKINDFWFLFKKMRKIYIYEFPKNKKGEYQIWVPYVIENKKSLIDYINSFKYIQIMNFIAYSETLPDLVFLFMSEQDKISNCIDNMTEEDLANLLENINLVFSDIKVVVPISKLNSTEYTGVLPDGRLLSNVSFFEAKKVIDEKFINNSSNDTIIENSMNFFNFECPFCGVPYVFKTSEEIPEKNFFCGNCDNVLIHYVNKNLENSYKFSFEKENIKYLKNLNLKKSSKK